MKKFKEMATYQWQVLGWRGALSEGLIFAAIIFAFYILFWICIYADDIANDTTMWITCGITTCIIIFFLWAARRLFLVFERDYYKKAESDSENV